MPAGRANHVYLYGLESNEVHLAEWALVQNVLARSFVGPGQLMALPGLIALEQQGIPSIRIAALHHPLDRVPGIPAGTHGLLNSVEVARALQQNGFSLALAGHLHRGYVQLVRPRVARDLYVLAAGTATQAVTLTGEEKQILSSPYASMRSQPDQESWKAAARKCNEFRTYEFDHAPTAPNKVNVQVQSYRYDPNKSFFARLTVGTFDL